MTSRKTLLYIGAVDENYRKLCYDIKDDGYTIIQSTDNSSALSIAKTTDVFIIIMSQSAFFTDDVAEVMETIKDYCEQKQITLVSIQGNVIRVEKSYWVSLKDNYHDNA